jgi:hypothetical protein
MVLDFATSEAIETSLKSDSIVYSLNISYIRRIFSSDKNLVYGI